MAVGIPIRFSDNIAELRAHLKEGLNQIEVTRAGAEKLTQSLGGDRMLQAAHKYAAAIAEIGGATKLTTAEATRADAIFAKAIAKNEALGASASPLPDILKQIAANTNQVAMAEKNAIEIKEKLKKAIDDAKEAAEQQAAAVVRAAKEAEAAQQAAFKRTTDGLYGLSQGAKTVGTALTAAITVPLAGIAIAGVRASAPFEASMERLVSLAGVSSHELAGVKDRLLALAPAIGIGPQKLAEAMTIVSSTVSDTNLALSITETAAKGSVAGLGEAADVAKALTAIVNSYTPAVIDAARAADILTMSIKDGGAEAKQLAPVIGNVVPLAAQLGISFEEVGANIATVTKLGIPAAEAVTQLSSVFSGLLKETNKGRDALQSIGMTYEDLRKSVKDKGLMQTLIDMNMQFGDHKEKLTQVFGRIEALRDVMSTAGQQADVYRETLDHMKNSVGTLDGAFERMKGTQTHTWEELRAQIDVIAIRFGDALAPSLVKVLESMKPLLDMALRMAEGFGNLPEPIREFLIVMGGFAAVLGPAIFMLGQLAGSIRTLLLAYKELMEAEFFIKFLGLLAAPGLATAVGVIGGIALAIGGVALAAHELGDAFDRIDRSPSSGKLLPWLKDSRGFDLRSAKEEDTRISPLPTRNAFMGPTLGNRDALTTGFTLNLPGIKAQNDALVFQKRATEDILEAVKHLTTAQRAQIDMLKREGLSPLQIGEKLVSEGISKDVVSVYLKQQSMARSGAKSDPWAEYASASGPAYLDILNKIGNETYEGIAFDHQRIKSVDVLAKVYGTTVTVVREVIASEEQYAAAAKRSATVAEEVAALWVKANNAQEASGQKGPTGAIEKVNQQQQLELSKWSQHLQAKKITLEEYADAVDAIDTRADAERLTQTQKEADAELQVWQKNQNDIDAIRERSEAAEEAQGARGLDKEIAMLRKHADALEASWKQRFDKGTVYEGQYWDAIDAIEEEFRQLSKNKAVIAEEDKARLIAEIQQQAMTAEEKRGRQTLQAKLDLNEKEYRAAVEKYTKLGMLDETLAAALRKLYDTKGEGLKQADHLDVLAQQAKRTQAAFHALSQTFSELGKAFGSTSVFGQIFSGIGQFIPSLAGISAANKKLEEGQAKGVSPAEIKILKNDVRVAKQGAIAAGIGIGADIIVQNMNTGAGASTGNLVAAGALQGAATGAAIGAPFAAATFGISIAAGAGIGAIAGWIQSGKEWRKVVNDIGRDLGGLHVSEEFGRMIEDLEDTTGLQRVQAITTQLDKLIEQAGGLNDKNFGVFFQKFHDAFSYLEQGTLTIEQTTQIIDKNFAEFARIGTDVHGRWSAELKELIELNRAFGTQSKAVAEALKAQGVSALDGFSAIVGAAHDAVDGYAGVAKAVAEARDNAIKTGDAFTEIIAKMGQEERATFEAGLRQFKGTAQQYLSQQIELYQTTLKTDAKAKTYFSTATLDAARRAAETGDVFQKIIAGMSVEERKALDKAMVGFKGTVSEFLALQAALYLAAKSDDERLKTGLSQSTIDAIAKNKDAQAYVDSLVERKRAAAAAKPELDDLGTQAVGAYTAAVASGTSGPDALAKLHDSLQTLKKAYADLGLEIDNAALANLILQDDILSRNPALLKGLAGLSQSMVALSNLGLLNKDSFAAMQRTGMQMYTRLQAEAAAAGGGTRDALLPMQAYLHAAVKEAKELGVPLDANTKLLIDQSIELGIWKREGKTASEVMADAMQSMADAVADLVRELQGLPPLVRVKIEYDEYGNVIDTPPRNGPIRPNPNVPDPDDPEAPPRPPGRVPLPPKPGEPTPPTPRPPHYIPWEPSARGGLVTEAGMRYLASGGFVKQGWRIPLPIGTDTVPTMLTPGEGVVSKLGMSMLGEKALAALNRGASIPDLSAESDAMFRSLTHWGDEKYQHLDDAASTRPVMKEIPGGGDGGEIHYHTWKIAISALDETDLRRKVEKEILPMVIDELEDNRRASARRMGDALRRAE